MDGDTGKTIAVMDGGYLTAMRTGAVSGLATRYLARSDAKVAGILGTGVQARAQLWGMAISGNIESGICFSMDTPENQASFAESMSNQLGISVSVAGSTQEVIESSDVFALATTATTPIVNGDWIKPGTHINAIGSHAPGVRELDTITRASAS